MLSEPVGAGGWACRGCSGSQQWVVEVAEWKLWHFSLRWSWSHLYGRWAGWLLPGCFGFRSSAFHGAFGVVGQGSSVEGSNTGSGASPSGSSLGPSSGGWAKGRWRSTAGSGSAAAPCPRDRLPLRSCVWRNEPKLVVLGLAGHKHCVGREHMEVWGARWRSWHRRSAGQMWRWRSTSTLGHRDARRVGPSDAGRRRARGWRCWGWRWWGCSPGPSGGGWATGRWRSTDDSGCGEAPCPPGRQPPRSCAEVVHDGQMPRFLHEKGSRRS